MKIGPLEIVVIFIVALIVIGPNKLPEYAQKLGAALKEFRKASASITKDIQEEVVEPLQEAQRPIKEALEPITDLNSEIQGSINDVKKGFNDLSKPIKLDGKKESTKSGAKSQESADLSSQSNDSPVEASVKTAPEITEQAPVVEPAPSAENAECETISTPSEPDSAADGAQNPNP